MNGRISKFDTERGFGFITPGHGGPDIFFHISGLERGIDTRDVKYGLPVSYEEQDGPKGVKAGRIKLLTVTEEDRWPEYAAGPNPYAPVSDGQHCLMLSEAAFRELFNAVLAHGKQNGWV